MDKQGMSTVRESLPTYAYIVALHAHDRIGNTSILHQIGAVLDVVAKGRVVLMQVSHEHIGFYRRVREQGLWR